MSALRNIMGKKLGKKEAAEQVEKGPRTCIFQNGPFFASLHFLRDNITPRKTTNNLGTDMSEEKENEAVHQDQPSQQATQQVPDDDCVQGSVFPIDNPPSVKNKKKRSLAFEDELLSTCLEVMKWPKEDVNDADIVFGQYVSKQLKKIPEGCKVFLQFNSIEKNTTVSLIALNYNSPKWRLFCSGNEARIIIKRAK